MRSVDNANQGCGQSAGPGRTQLHSRRALDAPSYTVGGIGLCAGAGVQGAGVSRMFTQGVQASDDSTGEIACGER